jgi:hypothetical protein
MVIGSSCSQRIDQESLKSQKEYFWELELVWALKESTLDF